MAVTVTGRVADWRGAPVAGAIVAVTGPVPLPDIARMTGADGAFDFVAPVEGTYKVQVNDPAGGRARSEIAVAAEAPPPLLRIDLPRSG
jgi:hypothetical protein